VSDRFADQDFVAEILTTVEAAAEASGWDRPASLFAIEIAPISDDVAALTACPFPGFSRLLIETGYCVSAMTMLRSLLSGPGAAARIRQAMPGLVALVLVDEAWMLVDPNGIPDDHGSLAEHPDRVEKRFAWLQAMDGSSRVVLRERGDVAAVQADDWRDGRVPEVMAALLETVLGH
jgi:hypothetical protein